MWSGRGDSLVAYPHFFGVLATSICNNLPYRFRLLVHNFLGIIFVDQKKAFFFGCDADETVQYVVFLNSFDVSGLYLEILFLATCVCLLDPEI